MTNLSEMCPLDKMSSVTAEMNSRYISSSSLSTNTYSLFRMVLKIHPHVNGNIQKLYKNHTSSKRTYSVDTFFIMGDFLLSGESLKDETSIF